jgi:hypothetical protein
MVHECVGVSCMFPGCLNNPHNQPVQFRHRPGLRRLTLAEFRKKYGTNGVSEIINYLIEHIPLSEQSTKDFKQLANDIKSLLTED